MGYGICVFCSLKSPGLLLNRLLLNSKRTQTNLKNQKDILYKNEKRQQIKKTNSAKKTENLKNNDKELFGMKCNYMEPNETKTNEK